MTAHPASTSIFVGLVLGLCATSLHGCEGPISPAEIAKQCGLDVDCSAGGFAEGKASISGIASIDAFFGASIDLVAQARAVDAGIRAELAAIALSLGLNADAGIDEIEAAIQAKIGLAVDGGLDLSFAPPRCEASVEVIASAAAECDAEVDPGEVSFECSGSCTVEAGVAVDCGAEAELRCEYTAADIECGGTCRGTCELEAGARCEGTCKGGCEGTCSVENADGTCNGTCDGTCTGSCELQVGAECEGTCQGTCEVTANPEVGCEAGASARCEAMADGKVECSGSCEGKAAPPSVSAECEASVEAKANASVECTPPTIEVNWRWSANAQADAQAQSEFKGWINAMKIHFAALAAQTAKAELLLAGGQALVDASGEAVLGFAQSVDADADVALRDAIGASCALRELPIAADALVSATAELTSSFEAAGRVTTALRQ